MSDSNHSTAVSNEVVAGLTASVSVEDSTKSTGSIEPLATVPKSSPPLLDEDNDKSHLSQNTSLISNGNLLKDAERDADADADADADGDNDSEAETLISSPVKKREALKKAQEQDTRRVGHKAVVNNDDKEAADVREIQSRVSEVGEQDKDVGQLGAITERSEGEELGQNEDDSDNLSDVLSVQSSFADSETKGNIRSADTEGQDDHTGESAEDESEGGGILRNGDTLNPRKRKHRESYMDAGAEPRRRRRRASDEGHAHARGENVESSSPQLRKHRRTISGQSNWNDANRSVSRGGSVAAPVSGRQRRAATHFPVHDAKATRNNWDSDASSETSHQHHFNRLSRNINRSTSTPGRPMGRDHKRHVNKYGFTRLAEACENGDLDLVKEWHEKDPEQLEQREFAGNTPLQVASLNGFPEIVSYLLAEKCNPHTANTDQDTPLIDAVENGHIEVVRLLLKAGVNPLRQNLKGQQALDVVTEETENCQEIRAVLREAIDDWRNNDKGHEQQLEAEPAKRPGPSKQMHFIAYTTSNLVRLAGENDRDGIIELLQSQVQVSNEAVAAAAKTGDTFTVSMLLAEIKPKDARKKPELPMLAVVGSSHFEMVKYLSGGDRFNPTWRSRSNGMTWYELAEKRQGPNWQQEKELLKQLYDERMSTERLSSSPVSRRDNGKRRRSPTRQKESDAEMEDPDSNEQARSRRRLVSKKVMREESNRRRSFSSSNSDGSGSVSGSSSRMDSPDNASLRPPPPRKVGRPRKISSTRVSEPHSQRRRFSPSRELPVPSDTSHVGPSSGPLEEESHLRNERKIKIEDSERRRLEAEAEAEAEANKKAELEAKVKAEELAEEQRRSEEKKKEEEEARRKDAERKAEEIRLQHQRRMAEERRIKEEKQIQALPSALRHVLGLLSCEKQRYIQRHFLPVQVVKRSDLGPMDQGEEKADELWMLNYQAAAILTKSGAADLLNLPADPLAKQSALSGFRSIETSPEQRRAMLPCLQSSNLVHEFPASQQAMPSDDLMAEFAMAEQARLQIAEDRSKFLSMTPLRWIRFSDFYNAATTSDSPDYSHLSGIELNIRFDCCLDPTPFVSEVTTENGTLALNGTKVDDTDAKTPLANGLKGKHESAPVHRAGPGMTTFTIVQD
ncbi:hypothetical protein BDV97DRAFT_156803 [Delphinella strobiligena]|nr:hypothetical protein BDV97DRAFT_156803 [Delphinella strobiligena]